LNFAPPGSLVVQPVVAGSGANTVAVLPSATPQTASLPAVDQVFQYPLSLTTNELVNIGANTDIKGNVQISSVNSQNNATAVLNAGGIIEGTLSGNAGLPNVAPSVVAPTGAGNQISNTSNVYADADLYNSGTNPNGNPNTPLNTTRVGANQTPAINDANLAQVLPAPALIETGSSLPDFASTGNNLPAGDYAVSALDTGSSSQFPSSVTVGSPVRLFVQDGNVNSDGSAVNISSNVLSTAALNATNFQIWYSGVNPININLTNGSGGPGVFNGTIYAPNATVTTSGNGIFTGAIVAGVTQINHQGSLNLRTDLSTPGGAGPGLSYNYGATGSVLTGYKPVTWEEPQL
jgi:hypothetical protein